MNRKLLVSGALICLMTGCSSTNVKDTSVVDESSVSEASKPTYHYKYTLNKSKEEMGNTALRVSSYVHVLSKFHGDGPSYEESITKRELWEDSPNPIKFKTPDPISSDDESEDPDVLDDSSQPATDISAISDETPKVEPETVKDELVVAAVDHSDPHYSLYQKYCDVGIGMTEDDWDMFFQLGGVDTIPEDLLNDCVHPKM